MPLLRRQAFVKEKPPPGLKDDEDVFACKTTGEVFTDYDKFFERTILCNSLVWTCELTGKSGLTFQEALDSEEKASKTVAAFPEALQRTILYLMTLTHRSRLNDVNDDIYNFVKEHYFIGEVVEVQQHGEKKLGKIVKVISPSSKTQNGKPESIASSDDDSVICLDDPPKTSPKKTDEEMAPPDAFEYVVQEVKKTNIYIMKADNVSRKRGTFTREKSKMFLKQHCALSSFGIWQVKEKFVKKLKLSEVSFKDFFEGPQPTFKVTEAKKIGRPSGSASSSVIDLTDEDRAIKEAKKEQKERKKREKEIRKNERRKKARQEKKLAKAAAKAASAAETTVQNIEINDEPDFENLRKLSAEEKQALREQIKADKIAARLVQLEELKKKREEEKLKKKEEREKERKKKKVPTATLR